MDDYSGDIILPDGSLIEDIRLQHDALLLEGALRFLSFVRTDEIPLYLASGPSREVWTTSAKTEQWFQAIFLSSAGTEFASLPHDLEASSSHKWWATRPVQSPIGVLAQVQTAQSETSSEKPQKCTEILFYGAVSDQLAVRSLPTPPATSLPHQNHNSSESPEYREDPDLTLRVLAQPLCSAMLYNSSLSTTLPSSPRDMNVDSTILHDPNSEMVSLPREPRGVTILPDKCPDIFAKAIENRRQARRKGGESVAALASKASGIKDASCLLQQSIRPDVDASVAARRRMAKTLTLDTNERTHEQATQFNRSVPTDTKHSISDVYVSGHESLSSGAGPDTPTGTAAPSACDEQLAIRNKEAISRVVMAGLRLHGLEPQKRCSKFRKGSLDESVNTCINGNEQYPGETGREAPYDEFKSVYHQVYKGTVFAFRSYISKEPLHMHSERVRETVDKLLAIYCADPFAESTVATVFALKKD